MLLLISPDHDLIGLNCPDRPFHNFWASQNQWIDVLELPKIDGFGAPKLWKGRSGLGPVHKAPYWNSLWRNENISKVKDQVKQFITISYKIPDLRRILSSRNSIKDNPAAKTFLPDAIALNYSVSSYSWLAGAYSVYTLWERATRLRRGYFRLAKSLSDKIGFWAFSALRSQGWDILSKYEGPLFLSAYLTESTDDLISITSERPAGNEYPM